MTDEIEGNGLKRSAPGDSSIIVGSSRKRVAVACSSCRLRKTKCDGWRPQCSTCRSFGFECIYTGTASTSEVKPSERSSERLDVIENIIKQQPTLDDLKELFNTLEETIIRRIDSKVIDDDSDHSEKDKSLISLQTRLQDDSESHTKDISDGMGTLNFADEEDSIYFGPSSTVAFIGHISSVISLGSHSESQTSPLYQTKLIISQTRPKESPRQRNPQQVNKFAIPSKSVVMSLLDQYFRNTYIIFPIFHVKTFISEYEVAVENGFTNVTRTWLARLNMVLAIATSASTDADISVEKHEKAEQFYLRAAGLYDGGRILKSASLESVQILILMSQYLQGTQKPIQCYHSLGLAIHTALQLGLHSKQALKKFPPLERELRKRTWHACVLVDRTICMTFGRPSAIPLHISKKIQLPLDVNDEVLEMATTETPEKSSTPTIQTFYIQSIYLYEILATIIDQIYGYNLDWNEDEEYGLDLATNSYELAARIAKIEKSIFIWKNSLPTELKIISAEEVHLSISTNTPDHNEIMNTISFILRRQRIILTLRYHSIRMLLHRQTISNCLLLLIAKHEKRSHRGSLNFEMDSIQTALESSIETINIVQRVGDHVSLLGAWWFTLYFVFKSSLVMVAVLVIYNEFDLRSSGVISADDVRTHLDTAISVIEIMSRKNEIADRCLLFLRYLRHAVSISKGLESDIINYKNQFHELPNIPKTHNERNDLDFGMGMGEFMLESDLNMLEELFKHKEYI